MVVDGDEEELPMYIYTLLDRAACCLCGEFFDMIHSGGAVELRCGCEKRKVFVERMWEDIEKMDVLEQVLFLNGIENTLVGLRRLAMEFGDISLVDKAEILNKVKSMR
jgi:hypothetical protein